MSVLTRQTECISLTPRDVQLAMQQQNIELPSGKLSGNATELTVRTFGRINTEEEFNQLIVANRNGSDIRLRDSEKPCLDQRMKKQSCVKAVFQ